MINTASKKANKQQELDAIDTKLGALSPEETQFIQGEMVKRKMAGMMIGAAVQYAIALAAVVAYKRFAG